ncbi:MAG: tetratricopeptide repeat protein [Beijerinckiaceae bacterium]
MAAAGPAFALDGTPNSRAASMAPLELFKNPRMALQRGMETYQKGDVANSLAALKYAAEGGEPLAQWKLGRMYADGEGVQKNDAEAYSYFARIVRDYKEDQLDPRERSVVASAFVAVGVYNLTGIPRSRVHKNVQRALHLFHYAATVFGNADAQYNLARMYLDGAGTERNPRQALPWLRYAAEKNHVEALAVLGNLLFAGDSGVARQRAKGLMYLTLARELAGARQKLAWVPRLHQQAIVASSDFDRDMAHVELKKYLRRRARGR